MPARTRWIVLAAMIFPALAAQLAPAAVIPLLEYKFNETGTSAASTGSDSTAVTLRNASGTATDLHGTAGSGVSGAPGDLAFDNSASTMGGSGGFANQADDNTIDGLSSFTLQTWYKPTAALNTGGARLLSNFGALMGFDFNNGSGNGWTTYVDSNESSNSSGVFNDAIGTWVFVATTYDSSTNTVTFYKGTKTTAVVAAGSHLISPSEGALDDNTIGLVIGNYSDPIAVARAFQGLIDDTRIFGSKTDSTGALGITDLEAIRQQDLVAPTPEPASLAMLTVGSGLVLARRRRAS